MRRLLRLHYGAEGDDFAIEDRAAPPAIRHAINNYFSGDLFAINAIPVTTGGTSFQREVWAALRTIRAGTTLSYGALARQLGRPKSVRAFGLTSRSPRATSTKTELNRRRLRKPACIAISVIGRLVWSKSRLARCTRAVLATFEGLARR
jgi:hypothetical protein